MFFSSKAAWICPSLPKLQRRSSSRWDIFARLLLFGCYSVVWKVNQKFCFVLFQLSNHQFEELAMDVYDEVDRRETDAGEILSLVYNAGYAFT